MTPFLDRLLRLWSEPLPEGPAAIEAFRKMYTDPVLVNGTPFTAAALVERARTQQRAFEGLQLTLLEQIEVPGKLIIVFKQRGRHVGPLATPIGDVPATGKTIERQIIDVLTFTGDLVSGIWVVSDDLGLLKELGAIKLA